MLANRIIHKLSTLSTRPKIKPYGTSEFEVTMKGCSGYYIKHKIDEIIYADKVETSADYYRCILTIVSK